MRFERGGARGGELDPGEPAGIIAFRRTFLSESDETRIDEDLKVLGRFGVVDLQCVANDSEVELVNVAQQPTDS